MAEAPTTGANPAPGSQRPTNAEKAAIWDAYYQRRPVRAPVRLNVNPRIILADSALNTEGFTYEAAAQDPKTHVEVWLRLEHHMRTALNHYTDGPAGLPDVWDVQLFNYNVYEAAYFGAPIHFPPDQVPATKPILDNSDYSPVFEVAIESPLENPYIAERLAFWKEMERVCRDMRFEGRPVRLQPWAITGCDGPVTVACNLRGGDFMSDLLEQPGEADRLLAYITEAAIIRRQAFFDYWGDAVERVNTLADDSCAMLSAEMYAGSVMPHHQRYYETGPAVERLMHLCGNASHLFTAIRRQLDVTSFDTGFPIDHGKIRAELGPGVEIAGGVPVDTLLNGSPNSVYEAARAILVSGVKEGGRFILQEANNLPPACPLENLGAMYQACLEHGRY